MTDTSPDPNENIPGTLIKRGEAQLHLENLQSSPTGAYSNLYTNSASMLLDCSLRGGAESLPAAIPSGVVNRNPWITTDFTAKYLKDLQAIRQVLDLQTPTIYVPGHGNDVSHCEAFHDAKAIYNLELGPEHVNMMRAFYADEPRVHSALGFVESYIPPEKADILLVAAPAYRLESWNYSALLKENAFVITTATGFKKNPLLSYMGTCTAGLFEAGSVKDTSDSMVTTDSELLERSNGGGVFATYASVLAAVYKTTGKTDSLVQRYTALRDATIEAKVEQQRASWTDPERIARIEALGINYGKSFWTEADSDKARRNLHTGNVRLTHNGEEFNLKPLPNVFRPLALDVYSFRC